MAAMSRTRATIADVDGVRDAFCIRRAACARGRCLLHVKDARKKYELNFPEEKLNSQPVRSAGWEFNFSEGEFYGISQNSQPAHDDHSFKYIHTYYLQQYICWLGVLELQQELPAKQFPRPHVPGTKRSLGLSFSEQAQNKTIAMSRIRRAAPPWGTSPSAPASRPRPTVVLFDDRAAVAFGSFGSGISAAPRGRPP